MHRAIIDIGTNSVKLLVADVSEGSVIPLHEESEQTRLGRGFYETSHLQPEAVARTASAVARLSIKAREWNPAWIRVIATSAARDAVNQYVLLQAVHQQSGLSVEVISGAQEADWAFAGVCTDPALAGHALLIVDIGGGSTEFILGLRDQRFFRDSFPLGTVRLLEQLRPADPPSEQDWEKCQAWLAALFNKQIQPVLLPCLENIRLQSVFLVGTGGTASVLGAMDAGLSTFERKRIESAQLSRQRVGEFQRELWTRSLMERKQLKGLPPDRADVAPFGVAIFAFIMETFGFDQLRISTRGLRFAAAMADCLKIEKTD